MSAASYLTTADVATLLHVSERTIRERTRLAQIPYRRIGGTRRCLFLKSELALWLDGCELEVVPAPNGGKIVRPVQGATR